MSRFIPPSEAAVRGLSVSQAAGVLALDARQGGERFVDTDRRVGAQPFKEKVHGSV